MSEQLKQRVSEMLSELDCSDFMDEYDPRMLWDYILKQVVSDPEIDKWPTIKAEVVDHYSGEGQGDKYWTVWKFTEGDESVLVKFNGWYASYVGAEYQDWSFVEPKQKTVTVYE